MKIIQIISSLWNGGAERFVVDLSNELSKTNEVIICSFRNIEEDMFFVKDINPTVRLVDLGKKKGFDLRFFFRIWRFIVKEKPDIINTHLASTIVYLYLPIIFLRDITCFHTVHNLAHEEETRPFFRKIRKLSHHCNLVKPISISDITDNSFKAVYGNLKSYIIYNGVKKPQLTPLYPNVKIEINKYKKDSRTIVFTSIGKMAFIRDYKNYRLLVKVFDILYKENKNVILLIIGPDSSPGSLKLKELESIKSPNTYFLGSKTNIADYLKCSDAFCLSSHFEGLPITILEALSFGLPVISTPVGGIPDIIKPQINGFLSKNISIEEYLKTVKDFLAQDNITINNIKKNNVNKFYDLFSIENTATNYLKLYRIPQK